MSTTGSLCSYFDSRILFESNATGVANNIDVVVLHDGSFIFFDMYFVEKARPERWTIDRNNRTFRLLGFFPGVHVWPGAVQKDENTLLTATKDLKVLKEWDLTSYELVKTHELKAAALCLKKTSFKPSTILCGLDDCTVELRRVGDLGLIRKLSLSFQPYFIHELADGSMVFGGFRGELQRWNRELESRLMGFFGHSFLVRQLVELKGGVIATASYRSLNMLTLSTGECFRTISAPTIDWTQQNIVLYNGSDMLKLSDDTFVTGSDDSKIQVWNDKGDCIETIHTSLPNIKTIFRVDDLIVISGGYRTAVWLQSK